MIYPCRLSGSEIFTVFIFPFYCEKDSSVYLKCLNTISGSNFIFDYELIALGDPVLILSFTVFTIGSDKLCALLVFFLNEENTSGYDQIGK